MAEEDKTYQFKHGVVFLLDNLQLHDKSDGLNLYPTKVEQMEKL